MIILYIISLLAALSTGFMVGMYLNRDSEELERLKLDLKLTSNYHVVNLLNRKLKILSNMYEEVTGVDPSTVLDMMRESLPVEADHVSTFVSEKELDEEAKQDSLKTNLWNDVS